MMSMLNTSLHTLHIGGEVHWDLFDNQHRCVSCEHCVCRVSLCQITSALIQYISQISQSVKDQSPLCSPQKDG